MKNEKMLKAAMKHGLYLAVSAVRMYLDTDETAKSSETSKVITEAMTETMHDVFTMSEEEFAELVALQSIGSDGYQKAIEKAIANKKDGEPTHMC